MEIWPRHKKPRFSNAYLHISIVPLPSSQVVVIASRSHLSLAEPGLVSKDHADCEWFQLVRSRMRISWEGGRTHHVLRRSSGRDHQGVVWVEHELGTRALPSQCQYPVLPLPLSLPLVSSLPHAIHLFSCAIVSALVSSPARPDSFSIASYLPCPTVSLRHGSGEVAASTARCSCGRGPGTWAYCRAIVRVWKSPWSVWVL